MHPNVPKLIYYTSEVKEGVCREDTDEVVLYLQHVETTLAEHLSQMQGSKDGGKNGAAFCSGLANGLGYLTEHYGYFKVSAEMIFLNKS